MELIQLLSTWKIHLCGDKGTIYFTPLNMVTPSIEEEVEVEEDEIGFMKDQQKD